MWDKGAYNKMLICQFVARKVNIWYDISVFNRLNAL